MVIIGVESRERKRLLEINRVKDRANQTFEKYFPNPARPPSENQFISKWNEYIDEIGITFGAFRDYRMAFNQGIKTIQHYQKEFNWLVQSPSFLITDKPKPQLRTISWLQNAWALNDYLEDWQHNDLFKHDPTSVQEAYRHTMLSFIVHSGHCIAEVIKAFSQLLISGSYEIMTWSNIPFIPITIDSSKFNTNISIKHQQATQFVCYLYPITQGLLKLWKKWSKEQWQAPDSWSGIIDLLFNKTLDMSYSRFCSAAGYTCEQQKNVKISQALLEYQIGRTKSYSIPLSNLTRLNQGQGAVRNIEDIPPPEQVSQAPSKSNYTAKGNNHHFDVFSELKACLYQEKSTQKLTSSVVRISLSKLIKRLRGSGQQNELVLIHWYYAKLERCTVSTLKTYHSHLSRKWLYLASQYALNTLGADELESVYLQAIESQTSKKSQKYFAARLKDLHKFGVEHYGFSAISSQYLHVDPTNSHTKSGFIDETLFVALLNLISTIDKLNDDEIQCVKSLCILSYRCGLRLSELKKLRIKDVEPSQIGWLSIRDNYLGNNKTSSSLRKVPLFPMLLPEEKVIIERYYQLKLEQVHHKMGSPLFSLSVGGKLPIDTFSISILIGSLLKSLSQLDYLVFHHLRHSCLSRLQLFLELNDDIPDIPQLNPYDKIQREKIHYLLFGHSTKNGYDAIAAFAGHESASMTFEHYFHFSDWIVAQKLHKANYQLTKGQAKRVGLNTKRALRCIEDSVDTNSSNDFLHKKLNIQTLTNPIENGNTPCSLLNLPLKETISILNCHAALSLFEEGYHLNEICHRFRIQEATLEHWIKNAQAIKAISTTVAGQNYSRHFTKARVDCLLPAKPNTESEVKLLNQYMKALKLEYRSNKEAIHHFILYALYHTSTSRSGIYFSNPDELKRFIKASHIIIPKTHWRAVTHYLDASIYKDEWKVALNGVQRTVERAQTKRSKKSIGSVRLELKQPNKLNNRDGRVKRSSSSLMYIVHMMGIMLPLNIEKD